MLAKNGQNHNDSLELTLYVIDSTNVLNLSCSVIKEQFPNKTEMWPERLSKNVFIVHFAVNEQTKSMPEFLSKMGWGCLVENVGFSTFYNKLHLKKGIFERCKKLIGRSMTAGGNLKFKCCLLETKDGEEIIEFYDKNIYTFFLDQSDHEEERFEEQKINVLEEDFNIPDKIQFVETEIKEDDLKPKHQHQEPLFSPRKKPKKRPDCKVGYRHCQLFWDQFHLEKFDHPFKEICPKFACCYNPSDLHYKNFSHICPKERKCRDPECREIHIDYFQKEVFEKEVFRNAPPCTLFDLSKNVKFNKNIKYCSSQFDEYKKKKFVPKKEFLEYCQFMPAVHRCNVDRFQKMIKTGCVISLKQMKEGLKDIDMIVKLCKCTVQEHFSNVIRNDAGKMEVFEAYLARLIQFSKKKFEIETANEETVEKIKSEMEKLEILIKKQEKRLSYERIGFTKEKLKVIRNVIEKDVLSIVNNLKKGEGCQYKRDELIGTNEHVFAVLGNNTGHYGNVFLVFNPIVTYHPEFNCTNSAGTTFMSGFRHSKIKMDWKNTQLVKEGQEVVKKNIDAFNVSKMNPSCEDFFECCMKETIEKTRLWKINRKQCDGNEKIENITMRDYKNFSFDVSHTNSHDLIECHLPAMLPLQFVDKVYIKHSEYQNSLTDEDIKRMDTIFSKSWKDIFRFFPDHDFERSVFRDIDEEIEKRKRGERMYKGFCFTLEKSNMYELPIELEIRKNYSIQFLSFGTQFFVFLEDSKKEENCVAIFFGDSSMPIRKVHFISRKKGKDFEEIVLDQNSGERRKMIEPFLNGESESKTFNKGFDEKCFYVSYEISLDFSGRNGKVSLRHQEYERQVNGETLVFNLEEGCYFDTISIMKIEENVSIRNFQVFEKVE